MRMELRWFFGLANKDDFVKSHATGHCEGFSPKQSDEVVANPQHTGEAIPTNKEITSLRS